MVFVAFDIFWRNNPYNSDAWIEIITDDFKLAMNALLAETLKDADAGIDDDESNDLKTIDISSIEDLKIWLEKKMVDSCAHSWNIEHFEYGNKATWRVCVPSLPNEMYIYKIVSC